MKGKAYQYTSQLKVSRKKIEALCELMPTLVQGGVTLADGLPQAIALMRQRKPHPVWDDLLSIDLKKDVPLFIDWLDKSVLPATRNWPSILLRMYQKQFTATGKSLPHAKWSCGVDVTDFDYMEEVDSSIVLPGQNTIFRALLAAECGFEEDDDASTAEALCWAHLGLMSAEAMRMMAPAKVLGTKKEQRIGICVIEFDTDVCIGKMTPGGWQPAAQWDEL